MTINEINMRKWRGLTLVEVIAAALILAITASAALSVVCSGLIGLRTQSDQLVAQHHARNLIAEWKLSPRESREPGAGTCPGAAAWQWTRSVAPHSDLPNAPLRLVTLTLNKNHETRNSKSPLYTWTWIEPLENSQGHNERGM